MRKVDMKYLRLNLIDVYNNEMNAVDLADQLRNCYRMNHWFRNRKWWWAIMMWAIGVAHTNAYIMYCRMYEEEAAKKKEGLPKKWTHLEFLTELVYDFIWPGEEVQDTGIEEEGDVSSRTRSATSATTIRRYTYNLETDKGVQQYFENNKAVSITASRMQSNFFAIRFDNKYHPSLPAPSFKDYCQYCRYKHSHVMNESVKEQMKWMHNNRLHIRRCLTCNVNLCGVCANEWHGYSFDKMNAMVDEN